MNSITKSIRSVAHHCGNFANVSKSLSYSGNQLTQRNALRLYSASGPPIVPSHEEQYREQQKRNQDAGVLTELVRDFLDPADFYDAVRRIGIDFFTGVPDSLLKGYLMHCK